MSPQANAATAKRTRSARDARTGFTKTRADHATELAEDYVELIEELTVETGEARAADIAKRLGVSHVTVTKTVSRLIRDGLVTRLPRRSIFLTDQGRSLAEKCRKRHEFVLRFLVALGVPRNDAEIDAEGIEHHLSPTTMAAMKRFLRTH